jgi:hypothetical protein|tara:strand:- start:1006 stop:1209 length:204 start_codon:yes stop_codon:yes gene_type:complete
MTSAGTFWNLAASGLNSGVSINCKNIFDKRRRKPTKLFSLLPRLIKSALEQKEELKNRRTEKLVSKY